MKLKKKSKKEEPKSIKKKASIPMQKEEEELSESLVELGKLLDEIDAELKGHKPTYEDEEVVQAEVIKEQREVKASSKPNKKKVKDSSNLITIKEIAIELKVESKKLRKWLRNNLERKDGRWEWEEGHPELQKLYKAFGKK